MGSLTRLVRCPRGEVGFMGGIECLWVSEGSVGSLGSSRVSERNGIFNSMRG